MSSSSNKRKRHTPEQVIAKLREAEAILAGGKTLAQVCQHLEVSEPTYHRWRERWSEGSRPSVTRSGRISPPPVLRSPPVSVKGKPERSETIPFVCQPPSRAPAIPL